MTEKKGDNAKIEKNYYALGQDGFCGMHLLISIKF